MVVDMRPAPDQELYFYQNRHGQVVFCITGAAHRRTDKRETSVFLPQICRRLVHLLPRLKNLRVRRTWRAFTP
jgi:sarcosine oxidase subunit beta